MNIVSTQDCDREGGFSRDKVEGILFPSFGQDHENWDEFKGVL